MSRIINQSTEGESSEASRPPREEAHHELARGVAINRYVVLQAVGSGGMGVVYAAYDPALDRKIALKLLRGGGGAAGPERLLKEAQSQARFAHANVVTVHDVGTFAGQVFIAMEFMSTSLRDWWCSKSRTPREIVGMFVEAGEGLAAAHALGMVHRDFKPENVLIGAEGRPRVSDFGLAETELAAMGHAVGTPAYMAPEQARRERIDARADQFSFCVALYEALYGDLPFPRDRDPQRPLPLMPQQPQGSTVLASVRRVLFKGLAEDPNARYPSMAELLADLRDDPAQRRRTRLLQAAVSAAIVALVAGITWAMTRETAAERELRVCTERAGQRIDAMWGPARQAMIQSAFGNEAVWSQVNRRLDSEVVQWRVASVLACQPTLSPAERKRFSDCLDERRKILHSMSDVFSIKDPRVTENAINAVMLEVHPVSDCYAREAVLAPSLNRSEIDEKARSDLARIRVMMTAGKYEEAVEAAETLKDLAARAAEEAPDAGSGSSDFADRGSALEVKAEAALLEGELRARLRRMDADEPLRKAIEAADAISNDELRLRAMIAMVAWCADHRRKHVDGRWTSNAAQALLERLGSPPLLEASLLSATGVLDARSNQPANTVEKNLRRALKLRLENLPNADEHPLVAQVRTNLGLALPAAQGLPLLQSVLETSRRVFGANHPETALALHNLGVLRLALNENAAALDLFQQAMAIREQNRLANPHADPARLGREHTFMARALRRLGQLKAALEHDEIGVQLLRDSGVDPDELYTELTVLIDLRFELRLPTQPLIDERNELQVD